MELGNVAFASLTELCKKNPDIKYYGLSHIYAQAHRLFKESGEFEGYKKYYDIKKCSEDCVNMTKRRIFTQVENPTSFSWLNITKYSLSRKDDPFLCEPKIFDVKKIHERYMRELHDWWETSGDSDWKMNEMYEKSVAVRLGLVLFKDTTNRTCHSMEMKRMKNVSHELFTEEYFKKGYHPNLVSADYKSSCHVHPYSWDTPIKTTFIEKAVASATLLFRPSRICIAVMPHVVFMNGGKLLKDRLNVYHISFYDTMKYIYKCFLTKNPHLLKIKRKIEDINNKETTEENSIEENSTKEDDAQNMTKKAKLEIKIEDKNPRWIHP